MHVRQQNLKSTAGPSHATVFIWLFSVSAIWHYTSSSEEIVNYWLRYDALVTPLIFLSIVSAFIAACYPTKILAVMAMCIGQLIAIGLRMPFVADHLVMELYLNVSILISFLFLAWKQRTLSVSVDEMFAVFSPIGRWLLMIMYFYGTFHKLNPGFMSVESSCAVPFISGFPVLQGLIGTGWLENAAIYGTLILEAIALLLLLTARSKYFGMLLGMSFHLIIGISGYGTLAHFSAFALALHTLFLPSGFGSRMIADRFVPTRLRNAGNFRIATVVLIGLQVVFALHLGMTYKGIFVNSLFAAFAISLMYLVFKYGQMHEVDTPYRLKSPVFGLHLVPVLFFLHCLSPYIGLGTGGTMAMFSGLRTEGGVSNHYVIREPIPFFSYQDKVVFIESATNPSLQQAAQDGQGIVIFDFQRHFSIREQLALPIVLTIDDVRYELDNLDSLVEFSNQHFTEQSWLERKYMSFRLVDDPQPKQCRH